MEWNALPAWQRAVVVLGSLWAVMVLMFLGLMWREARIQTKCAQSVAGETFLATEDVPTDSGRLVRADHLGDCTGG